MASRLLPPGKTQRWAPVSGTVQAVQPLHSAVTCQCVELDLVPALMMVYSEPL